MGNHHKVALKGWKQPVKVFSARKHTKAKTKMVWLNTQMWAFVWGWDDSQSCDSQSGIVRGQLFCAFVQNCLFLLLEIAGFCQGYQIYKGYTRFLLDAYQMLVDFYFPAVSKCSPIVYWICSMFIIFLIFTDFPNAHPSVARYFTKYFQLIPIVSNCVPCD